MAHDIPPAIRRPFGPDDRSGNGGEHPAIIGTPYDGVTFTRGLGDSGRKVQVVEHECPACSHDRMVREIRVNPESRDHVQYWCLYPNCQHFVSDTLSHIMQNNYPQRPAREPAVYEPRA